MPALATRIPSCLLALSLLAGCASQAVPSPAEPTRATPSHPPPTATAASTPVPATSTPAGCGEQHGRFDGHEVVLPDDVRPLSYRLYLPPCFDPDAGARYPALYLLHGLAQTEADWETMGLGRVADELIRSREAPPFVIVLPGERTGYDMLAALTGTLLPELESTLPIGGNPQLRAIGGISRGAGWALRIGAQRPDLFGAIGLHSPAVLSPDLYLLSDWSRQVDRAALPRLWLDIGYDDTLLPKAFELRQVLDQLRWPYTWSADRGEHTSSYWSAHLEAYVRWYAEGWAANVQSGQAPPP